LPRMRTGCARPGCHPDYGCGHVIVVALVLQQRIDANPGSRSENRWGGKLHRDCRVTPTGRFQASAVVREVAINGAGIARRAKREVGEPGLARDDGAIGCVMVGIVDHDWQHRTASQRAYPFDEYLKLVYRMKVRKNGFTRGHLDEK